VGFAGRLVFEKGIFVLLRAFRAVVDHVSEARLLVAGDGPERASLRRQIAELRLGDNVIVTGHLPREELDRRFDQVWVQVVPSLVEETFGLVAAEAMMRGCATVVTTRGGLAETVQHGQTGLHVPPGDADALAQALLVLLRDREAAEAMGARARVFALSAFDEDRYLDKILDVYRRAGAQG
jgi:glycosyltransferase involved in cell wall biosynthesis